MNYLEIYLVVGALCYLVGRMANKEKYENLSWGLQIGDFLLSILLWPILLVMLCFYHGASLLIGNGD